MTPKKHLVVSALTAAGLVAVLSGCGDSGNKSTGADAGTGTTASQPAAPASSAPAAATSTGSDASSSADAGSSAAAGGSGEVPAAIKAAGGTALIAGTPAKGIEAQYGPICKGSDLGIGKIDFAKDTIGWAQSEKEANPFRIASTKSQVDEAKKRGIHLLTTNAQSNVQQENSDIKGMIDKGAKAIIFSPINSTGLGDAIAYAKSKHVAMIPVDRNITGVQGCQSVGPQLGSDFVLQGKRAADAMIKATGGKAKLAILLGATGVNVTDDRTSGFLDELKAQNASGIQVIFKQTADFTREKGQQVTETLLQSHPDVNAIYAENDEMALGAITALQDKGKNGTDKVHIVSIDGTKGAVQAIVDGDIDTVIESNPAYGPSAEDALNAYVNGDGYPAVTITTDNQYDKSNAQQAISSGTAY
ncbi:ribose transport system substrate-binding protein [Motilibacter rhizosphaerae]|uniref:Ribose transport system substrate-binding protein n=1 Tax=Motilibacter rhizosphaerae TaxID=598652 RepID=A0A4Q7NQX1_9ACTN|nr:substrate-binding domain-containing protein [Motilibacter rhizosphaerae]RZS87426.1 ribose transport system substrate-binding protein [Motilibacter rhizosphaerae]